MKRLIPLLLLFSCPVIAAQAQINAFGLSTGISGDNLLVGHPAPFGKPGTVFIFQRSLAGSQWNVAAELTASDGTEGDWFGYALNVRNNRLVVGAPSLEAGAGAIYVFERDMRTGGWTETAKLTAGEADQIGANLAVGPDFIASGGMRGGAPVVVFTHDADGWMQSGSLAPAEIQEGSLFGISTSTDGETIYVGAPGSNEGAGVVHVFRMPHEEWVETQILDPTPLALAGTAFGVKIQALNGDQVLVGAPGLAPNVQPTAPPPPGNVVWAQVTDNGMEALQVLSGPAGNIDLYGFSFELDGHHLLVGAAGANAFSGAAYSYALDMGSGQWTMTGEIGANSGEQAFGMVLSLSDNIAIISAPAANSGEGAVSLVTLDPETGELSREAAISSTGPPIVLESSGSVDCTEGMASHFDCSNVDLLSFMTVPDLGGGESSRTNDIWGWTDLESGREYALVGRNDGTSFVDITDPANPVLKGDLPLTEGANPAVWRDIKVYQNYAFIVADGAGEHGMQVFDLTQLREMTDEPAVYSASALYDGIASAHNIVINEDTGYAFAVGSNGGGETCGGGLHIIRIQDPLNPSFSGCFADTGTGRNGTGYSHDAQCVIYNGPDTDYSGREICFNSNETALSISDVTDKDNTIALSNASYPNVAYAHQGWLTEDQAYFFMNDELDELQGGVENTRTLIWDVSDLDDPQLLKEHLSENPSSDHNLYILGDLMYQSNYESGLRILDISDVANPVEVGFFDTVPHGPDKPGFGGSWSNYPYFPSGSIVVTSGNEGLFIVKKRSVDT